MEEQEYDRLYEILITLDPLSKEYEQLSERLNQVVHIAKGKREAFPPPPPTGWRAVVESPILGIIRDVGITSMVLYHERVHVITTRLPQFVRTGKK
jgi:hypothetical protein